MNQPPTIDQALTILKDITTMRQSIPDAMAELVGLQGGWQVGGVHNERATTSLPFGLDQAHDSVDPDGPSGIRTDDGVQEQLVLLADWLNLAELTPPVWGSASYRIQQTLTANTPGTLHTPIDWEDWCDWEPWTDDLISTRTVVARLTGFRAQPIGLCPACGHTLRATMDDDGREDQVQCGHCERPEQIESVAISQVLALRAATDTDLTITGKEAIQLWTPHLDHKTLHDWVRHGRIDRQTGTPARYPLATINELMTRLRAARSA